MPPRLNDSRLCVACKNLFACLAVFFRSLPSNPTARMWIGCVCVCAPTSRFHKMSSRCVRLYPVASSQPTRTPQPTHKAKQRQPAGFLPCVCRTRRSSGRREHLMEGGWWSRNMLLFAVWPERRARNALDRSDLDEFSQAFMGLCSIDIIFMHLRACVCVFECMDVCFLGVPVCVPSPVRSYIRRAVAPRLFPWRPCECVFVCPCALILCVTLF